MRTIITGGCGFIGFALAQRLVNLSASSDEIILVDNISRHGFYHELNDLISDSKVKLIKADLSEVSELDKIPVPVDRVFHLAAIVGVEPVTSNPARVLRINTLSTFNVFDWFVRSASPGARLLFSSSSEVYSGAMMAGLDLPIPTPESVPAVICDLDNPRFSYALSKMWGEGYAKYLSVEKSAFMISVRYHNIYGPRMGYDHIIPQVTSRVVARQQPFKIIGAEQTRSFCFVDDAVEATRLVMESSRIVPGMTVNIGNQEGEIKIGKIYDMIFDICGWTPADIINIPAPSGSVSRRCPDTMLLENLTGYKPHTSICEGLKRTVEWYLESPKPNIG